MFKRFALMLAVIMTGLILVSCSSYTPGKVKDGVYRNSYFTITTPDNFTCYSGKNVDQVSSYYTEYANSLDRGANKTFNCEYSAVDAATEILVVSEDNVGQWSMDEFTKIITKQSNSILFSASAVENKDVTIDGITFRHLKINLEGSGIYSEYFIRQMGTKNVYIYIEYIENGFYDNHADALNAISSSV